MKPSDPHTPSTWLLADERASHRSQLAGVAGALGWQVETREIRYNKLAALANPLLGNGLWHVTPESRATICPPWPDLVIAAGRRAAPVALAIKKQSPGTKLVHLMWPGVAPAAFDLIAVPEHDSASRKGPNVIHTFAAPHVITRDYMQTEALRWQNRIARLPRPWIALLIGGSGKRLTYEDADFKTLSAYASAEAERLGGSLLITSSPRTGKKGEALVKSILTAPNLFHCWQKDGENPYIAFLGLADAIIAPGDSTSMCAQACSTGKPVYVFMPPHLNKATKAFREALFARGSAKPHTYPIRLDWQPAMLPSAAAEVADAIQMRLFHATAA